jgi:hypothetical protein
MILNLIYYIYSDLDVTLDRSVSLYSLPLRLHVDTCGDVRITGNIEVCCLSFHSGMGNVVMKGIGSGNIGQSV